MMKTKIHIIKAEVKKTSLLIRLARYLPGAWITVGAFAGLILMLLAVYFMLLSKNTNQTSIKKSAVTSPVDKCTTAATTIIYTCYKNELSDITAKQGPEAAMALIKQQYPTSAYVQRECHQLAHVVGRAALIKYSDLGDTYVHGDHFCASGYFHGASEEMVVEKGAAYMVANADKICATFAKKKPYSLDHYNCEHGLGHGFMEALDGNLFEALSACDNLTGDWEQKSCYSGVFMQNIMIAESPDQSDDGTVKYIKDDNPMYPCDAVADKYKPGCYIFQSSWALKQLGYDFSKVFSLCQVVDNNGFRQICYQSIGRDASGMHIYNDNATGATCMLGSDIEARSNCIIGAAKDYVYNYHGAKQAYNFCAVLDRQFQTTCNDTVKQWVTSGLEE